MSNLDVGEILGYALKTFKKYFMKIAALAVMVCLPIELALNFLDYRIGASAEASGFMDKIQEAGANMSSSSLSTIIGEVNTNAIAIYGICGILATIMMTVFTIAVVRITKDFTDNEIFRDTNPKTDVVLNNNNEKKTVSDYLSEAIGILPRYALAFLVAGVLEILGYIFCIAPGIVISVLSVFIVFDVALTRHAGFMSLKYTAAVIFQKPTILFFYIVAYFAEQLLLGIVSIPFTLVNVTGVAAVLSNAAFNVVFDILFAFVTIMITIVFLRNIHRDPKLEEELKKAENNDQE